MNMSKEGREFAGAMSQAPGRGRLEVLCLGPCDCGCGRVARAEIRIEDLSIALDTPGLVDALISVLAEGREKLWGPREEGS